MNRAPIALFVFRRPAHAARTIAALKANPGFADSDVHVFADAAAKPADVAAVAETRALVREALPDATLHFAETNLGLARSLSGGARQLAAAHGRVIVVEDDLLVAADFLAWMNAALDRYADVPLVMQVSGHSFPQNASADPYFLPFVTTWGWGTWDRAWQYFDQSIPGIEQLAANRALQHKFDLGGAYPYTRMAERQRLGQIDSWGIAWNWAVFAADGVVLYPPESLVTNDGFGEGATHTKRGKSVRVATDPKARGVYRFPAEAVVHNAAFRDVREHLMRSRGISRRMVDRLRSISRLDRLAT